MLWFQYKATDYVVKEPGKLELVFTPTGGKEHRMEVFTFKDRGGVGMSMYNTDEVNLLSGWNSVYSIIFKTYCLLTADSCNCRLVNAQLP